VSPEISPFAGDKYSVPGILPAADGRRMDIPMAEAAKFFA